MIPVQSNVSPYSDTHLTNFFFDGARADITKGLSMSPAFQTTHSFTLGSQTSSPSYNFGTVFATQNVGPDLSCATSCFGVLPAPQVFMQGGVDHDGNVNARLNQGWSANNVTKVQAQARPTST